MTSKKRKKVDLKKNGAPTKKEAGIGGHRGEHVGTPVEVVACQNEWGNTTQMIKGWTQRKRLLGVGVVIGVVSQVQPVEASIPTHRKRHASTPSRGCGVPKPLGVWVAIGVASQWMPLQPWVPGGPRLGLGVRVGAWPLALAAVGSKACALGTGGFFYVP